MWELDCEESWVPKNWCFWTVVLEKTLESPLDCKEIKPVHPKGDQSWVFIERTDVEAETPILWPTHVKSWLVGKDPDAGSDWGQEEKGMTEDETDGWMASLTRWAWVWINSGSLWWTGRPGMLLFMGLQRVRHDWATELNWTNRWSSKWSASLPCVPCFLPHVQWWTAFSTLWIPEKVPSSSSLMDLHSGFSLGQPTGLAKLFHLRPP